MRTFSRLLLISLFQLMIVAIYAQSKSMVTIKVYENYGGCMGPNATNEILILSDTDKPEKIELEKVSSTKDFEANASKVHETVIKYLNQGYLLVASNTSAWQCVTQTLYILTKQK